MGLGMVCGLGLNILATFLSAEAVATLHAVTVDGVFKLLAHAFLALLQVLVVPLVFVSLACGTAALEDVHKLGRIGMRTLLLYLATTAIAISCALVAALIIGPGRGFGLSTDTTFEATPPPPMVDVFINIFPRNVIESMSSGNMLQIIVFAILFGLAVTFAGKPGKVVLNFMEQLNEVIMKLVWLVMLVAPYGVFALMARTFATQGFDAFGPLLKYFFVVLGILFLHALVTYPLLLKVLGGLNPLPFLRKLREVQIFAFSTASSNATIPVTLRTLETRMGVKRSVASFTVPLGATINMDGTAIMQGVATVFIAQAYGLSLGATDLLVVILTATLASIGTAGVPGVGLIMLSMVLAQVGLPVEGIGLIIGIDRLLDMVRTAVNVTGDSAIGCIVAKGEGELDTDTYQKSIADLEAEEDARENADDDATA